MSDRKKRIIWGLVFIIGLLIFFYPIISDYWNQRRAEQLIVEYKENIENILVEDFEKEKQEIRDYNRQLLNGSVLENFVSRENTRDERYESLLNINNDGMMGYVEIPAIDIYLPIYHYTSEEVLKKNVGHLLGSSFPIGGNGSHAVLSAHRGLPGAKLFTDLNLLEKGDFFLLHILDEILTYEVDQIHVVEPHQIETLAINKNEDYVTLFTCTPYGINTQRLLVRGHRISTPREEELTRMIEGVDVRPNSLHFMSQIGSIILGIVVAAAIIYLIEYNDKRKTKNER